MTRYDSALVPIKYQRGDFSDISPTPSLYIGSILGDKGETFDVTIYPQANPMEPTNFVGKGFILYSLVEDATDPLTKAPNIVPIDRPYRLRSETSADVGIEIAVGATAIAAITIGAIVLRFGPLAVEASTSQLTDITTNDIPERTLIDSQL